MCEEQKAAERRMTFDRKINPLALAAFVISLGTLSWQIKNYLDGPEVSLFVPEQIVIASSEAADFPNREGDPPYAHIFARMSYVNSGATGYNATVRWERAIISIPGSAPFEQRWYRFTTADAAGGKLVVAKLSDVGPFPLPAGSSTTHLTLFQPWPHRCVAKDAACNTRQNYVTWEKFLELVKNQPAFEVQLIAKTFDAEPRVTATCKVHLSNQSYERLVAQSWASPACE